MKIKPKTLIVVLMSITLFSMFCGCEILDNLNTGGAENGGEQISEIQLEGTYVLEEITEEHLAPCEYSVNHNDNIVLGLMFTVYNGSRLNFESTGGGTGTFTIILSETAIENDTYFVVQEGVYQIEDDILTLTEGDESITLTIAEDRIIFSLPEFEVESGEHESHIAVYSFVFKELQVK